MFTPCCFPWSQTFIHIKLNIEQYAGILTEGEKAAKNALKSFVAEKNYNVESNIIDAIINELAKITSCTIKVHYKCRDRFFDHHAISPMDPHCQTPHALNLQFSIHIIILSVTPHELWS